MLAAKHIMSRVLVTVSQDTSALVAAQIMIKHRVTGLPVVSADKRLLGLVSEKDLFKLLYHSERKDMTVGRIMTTTLTTFDENDDLAKICECLITNSFRRVPILADGKLVGIISRTDVVKFILRLSNAQAAPSAAKP